MPSRHTSTFKFQVLEVGRSGGGRGRLGSPIEFLPEVVMHEVGVGLAGDLDVHTYGSTR